MRRGYETRGDAARKSQQDPGRAPTGRRTTHCWSSHSPSGRGDVVGTKRAMINFQQPMPNNKREIKQVTAWVEDALPDELEDVMVMVNEMQCFEPGCAPLETVVSLLGQKSLVFKIFKPVKEVLPEDVGAGLQAVLSGGTAAQHLGVVQQPAA